MDASHVASWNYNVVDFFRKYHKNINLLHLSDASVRKQHLPFGKGKLPFKELFKEIKKSKYKGTVIFEIFNFPKGTPQEEIQKDINKSITMFRKIVL